MITPDRVNSFWFNEIDSKFWFKKDPDFDQQIKDKFESTYWHAAKGELYSWRLTLEGRLAEILVLDQFSRNMFRDQAQAFTNDHLAVILSQEAINQHNFKSLSDKRKAFIMMPLMHSESPLIHELAVKMFSYPGLETHLEYELKHKNIIDRFGRYPHRNEVLGRESTPEESEFLKEPGSSF